MPIDLPALAEDAYRRLKDVESRSSRPPRHRQKLFLTLDKLSLDHKTGRLDRVADGLAFLAAAGAGVRGEPAGGEGCREAAGGGIMRRFWTDAERDALRELYPKAAATEVSATLGRTPKAVYQEAKKLGLAVQPRITTGQAFLDAVARLNAAGFPDQEIASALGCERHTVAKHRKALGLPSNARGDRYRARVRERTARQCEAAGVASLAEVRVLAFRKRAEAAGWPAGLAPREVQILDALAARGPMTRREIADAVGMPWLGSRASLRCKAGRGSYLANLAAYGLVVSLGRVVAGRGKGRSCHLYTLNLAAERAWRDGEAG